MSERGDESNETLLAVRNTLQLGGSLMTTLAIGVVMRLVVPRWLGPSEFGVLTFADAFTTTFFVALGLGVDVYVRKHVSVRPSHASDFFGGALAVRAALTVVVFVAMAAAMRAMHRPPAVRNLVYLFAVAQFLVNVNATLAAMLQAKGRVGGMSLLSVVSKIAWAAAVLFAIMTGGALWQLAAALVASEALKTVGLWALARRHLGLVLRLDGAATKTMILVSLPYYLGSLASTVYGRLDVTLLAVLGTAREVGWYAASSTVAHLALLMTPLIEWVLMPTFARAAARSREELFERVRGSTRVVLTVAIPVGLFVSVGADVWVRVLFGVAYAPAASAVRILATTFVLMYVGIIYAVTLMMLERAWTLTTILFGGLVVNVVLNLLFIRVSMAAFGEGGGGAGCALAVLGTEIAVTSGLVWVVGREAFDARTLAVLGKTLAACVLVVVADRVAAPLRAGRLVVDAIVYFAAVTSTGALELRELGALVAAARKRPAPA